MLILGIDTSGKSGGVTLARGDVHSFQVLESAAIAGGTFSAQLVPTVASILRKHRFAAKDLEGFAVVSGPGSFTGLRVGLSAAKGLAEALNKPIATVSLLEAMACSSEFQGRVTAAMDASRNEMFVGVYNRDDGAKTTQLILETLRTQVEFLEELQLNSHTAIITCDESIVRFLSTPLRDVAINTEIKTEVKLVPRPDSAMIAHLGLSKLLAGDTVTVEALDANYIRRSDAEVVHQHKGGR